MAKTPQIVFTGGGTTGHVTKNLIIMKALKKRFSELKLHYFGLESGKEAELVKPEMAEFHAVSAGKLRRYFSLQTIPDFFRALLGVWEAFWMLGDIKPNLVFSSGGFVALPTCIAAWMRGIKVISHETDTYPGLANRLIARFAHKILLGYQAAQFFFPAEKVIYTGNPVADSLFRGDAGKVIEALDLSRHRKTILVMGGSQGAQQINDLMLEILPELVKHVQIIHLTGLGKQIPFQHSRYRDFEYVTDEYNDLLNAADLVVTRAGGNSLAEVAALGKPAIIIPLLSSAGDHQRKNALEMQKTRPQWLILDDPELSATDLLLALETALKSPEKGLESAKMEAETTLKTILEQIEGFVKA